MLYKHFLIDIYQSAIAVSYTQDEQNFHNKVKYS